MSTTAAVLNGDAILQLKNIANGEISNAGVINVSEAGLAAFVAPTVRNSGVINARLGKVALAAGSTNATLDLYGDGLVEFALDGAKTKALVDNSGTINAEGGTVALSASAAKDVVDDVINMSGVVNVSSVSVQGGKIILAGGTSGKVKVSGKLNASGTKGGKVKVTGQNVEISSSGEVVNTGDAGDTYLYGDRLLFAGLLKTGTNATAEISARELSLGGTTDLGDGTTITFDPAILTVGAAEAATFVSAMNHNNVIVNVTADDQIILNAAIDTSAQVTNSKLNFKDGNADSNLQVDLNAYVMLGAHQRLIGDATLVNVAATGLIQNGIDVAKTTGATVNVAAGTFNENLIIRKNNLILNGAKAGVSGLDLARDGVTGETLIIAGNATPAIFITGDGVKVDGVAVSGGSIGIAGKDAANVSIINSLISGTQGQGIHLRDSQTFEIAYNRISATGQDGIDVRGSDNGTINDNNLTTIGQDGIDIDSSSNVDIMSNYVNDANGNGIEAVNGTDINIRGNSINYVDQRGILVTKASDVRIEQNGIFSTGWDGIHVRDITGVEGGGTTLTISNNNVSYAGYDGISVSNIDQTLEQIIEPGEELPFAPLSLVEIPTGATGEDYTVRITGNLIYSTGDDGIDATDITGNLFIDSNTVFLAGVFGVNYDDGYGADGIFVRDVIDYPIETQENTLLGEDPANNYAVVVTNNTVGQIASLDGESGDIYGAADDGIEVLDSARTYIGNNSISFVGEHYESDKIAFKLIADSESNFADGIRVHNVFAYPDDFNGPTSVEIAGNTIYHTGDDGVDVRDSGRTYIHDNIIEAAGYGVTGDYYGADEFGADGIYVSNVTSNDSVSEDIYDDEGYYSFTQTTPTYGVHISHNTITTTEDDGIDVTNPASDSTYPSRTLIDNNIITNAGAGFYSNGEGTEEGSFGGYDSDGIHVQNVFSGDYDGTYSVEIRNNTINVTSDDGIEVLNSGRVYIGGNTISNVGAGDYGDGELYNNFGGSDYYGADGIHVRYSGSNDYIESKILDGKLVYGGEEAADDGWVFSVTIEDNDIDTTQDDGIEVVSSGRTLIQNNDVRYAGFLDGIDEYGYYGYYYNDGYGADGIHVRDVDVSSPYYYPSIVSEGYYGGNPTSVEIISNNVNVDRETGEFDGITADDGIQVLYSGDTLIDQNKIANSGYIPEEGEGYYGYYAYYGDDRVDYTGADGINVETDNRYSERGFDTLYEGYYGYDTNVEITNNFVDNSVDDGIEVVGATHVLVDANDVAISGDEGIVIYGYGNYAFTKQSKEASIMLYEGDYNTSAVVTNNKVNNSDYAGIEVNGYDFIEASFNDVSDTVNTGLFISGGSNGNVHVEGNTFTSNDVHAFFQSGLIDLTGASNSFNGGRVGLRFAPIQYTSFDEETNEPYVWYQSYLELVDDDAPGVDPATTEPPTNFGGTIGAQIFNGQSQYFVELDNGAFFNPGSPTWLNGLSSSYNGLVPADTDGFVSPANAAFLESRFFHFIDDSTLGRFWFGQGVAEINQEDIFKNIDPFTSLGGQISVTLLGLPRLPGGGNPPSGTGPINFNDIAPAAGDDGTAPQDIEPAAGGNTQTAQNSSCWADASFNAQNGNSTSFSFSSTIGEDTLAQDSSCGTGQQPQ